MKRHIVGTLCFAVFVLGLAAVASAQDGRTCSNASLAGAWGFTETGTVIAPTGPVPAAAVGRYDFDGAGNFAGTQYSSVGGTVAQDVKLGTYTVNADCTGTLTLKVYSAAGTLLRSSIWAIALTEEAREFRGTMKSLVLPNGVGLSPIMSMTATRMFPGLGDRTCSDAARGTWGYSWTATIILPTGPAPATAVGTMRGDAAGKLSGIQTISVGGLIGEDTLFIRSASSDVGGTRWNMVPPKALAYLRAGTIEKS